MKNENFRWYIHPLDSHTNEVVANELTETEKSIKKRCADKTERNLWECGRKFLNYLNRSKGTANLRFKIFVQRGVAGVIQEWKFD